MYIYILQRNAHYPSFLGLRGPAPGSGDARDNANGTTLAAVI